MRKYILTLILGLFTFIGFGQLPYSWTTGVNPGWVGSGGLQWRNGCSSVTTNCTGSYTNNLNTTYTSPIINTTCSNASTINVSFDIIGNAESGWDFLFLEYSLNGGTTWINPYGVGVGWTGNFTTLYNISNILSSSANFRFRFTFTSDASRVRSGYKISNFQIVCNPALPIELLSFDGTKKDDYNLLKWTTASENNNDYFTIERSEDGENWEIIDKVSASGNSTSKTNYSLIDDSYRNVINYYRLRQTDNDGKYELFDKIVGIDNRLSNKKVIKTTNLLGQDIDENYKGLVIDVYEDNTTSKRFQ